MKPNLASLLASAALVALPLSACSKTPVEARGSTVDAGASSAPPPAPASDVIDERDPALRSPGDAPLEPYRVELFDVAFGAASAMPLMPHVKNRSRAQERVVLARLELEQRKTALDEIGQIENWRRGLCLGHLARGCAKEGFDGVEIAAYLDGALEVAAGGEEELGQSWRRDRILAAVGAAYVALGETDTAEELQQEISADSETGRVGLARAELADGKECDEFIAGFDALLDLGTLDQVRSAVDTAVLFYARYYDDEVRRGLLEAGIQSGVQQMPREIGVDVMRALARVAHERGDAERALEALAVAQELVDGARWRPDDQIKLMSRLAETRSLVGDVDAARLQADAALELFRAEREAIFDMSRGAPLRELAEAYVALDDRPAALEVYRQAVEEGALNPNARPRADDLVETCVSMALAGIEPDPALWQRIREIRAGLQSPW